MDQHEEKSKDGESVVSKAMAKVMIEVMRDITIVNDPDMFQEGVLRENEGTVVKKR